MKTQLVKIQIICIYRVLSPTWYVYMAIPMPKAQEHHVKEGINILRGPGH